MELLELKEKIVSNQIPKFLILTGEEIAIRDMYIDKIKKVLNIETRRCDSLSSIYSKLTNSTLDKSYYLYIISDDKELVSQENVWSKLSSKNFSGNNYVILTYNNIDKRGKFYKQNIDNIVEFEKLGEELLIKYIQKEFPLNIFNCKRFLQCTGYNYMDSLLELDKLKIISKKLSLNADDAFKYGLEHNIIHQEVKQDVFDFINSVADRNAAKSIDKLSKLKKLQEPDIKIISLLYTLFRNMLIVLTAGDGKGICERSGLSLFQIKSIQEHIGKYDVDECIAIMNLIQSVEQKYKSGGIEPTISVDYIITQIL